MRSSEDGLTWDDLARPGDKKRVRASMGHLQNGVLVIDLASTTTTKRMMFRAHCALLLRDVSLCEEAEQEKSCIHVQHQRI